MRLNVSRRENLRESVKNFIVNNPKMKKPEIVNHFLKKGYARSNFV